MEHVAWHRTHSLNAPPRHRSRLRAALLIGVLLVLVVTGSAAPLVFSHTPVDAVVSHHYRVAIARDPGHAGFYGAAYRLYHTVTGANLLHYGVHRVAERFAVATGHPQAASAQAIRASYHDPKGPLAHTLRGAWQRLRSMFS